MTSVMFAVSGTTSAAGRTTKPMQPVSRLARDWKLAQAGERTPGEER